MRDTDTIIDERRTEGNTVREIDAAVDAVLGPQAAREIDAYLFDGSVILLHGPDSAPATEVEFAIARSLRGGRHFDPGTPSDWHVVERDPVLRPGLGGGDHLIGTRMVFNRSLRAPAGYSEPAA